MLFIQSFYSAVLVIGGFRRWSNSCHPRGGRVCDWKLHQAHPISWPHRYQLRAAADERPKGTRTGRGATYPKTLKPRRELASTLPPFLSCLVSGFFGSGETSEGTTQLCVP